LLRWLVRVESHETRDRVTLLVRDEDVFFVVFAERVDGSCHATVARREPMRVAPRLRYAFRKTTTASTRKQDAVRAFLRCGDRFVELAHPI